MTVLVFSEINDISCEVRRRKWNWLGHILEREGENDCFTALGWTPEGQRTRGRPKTTWRRTVEKERQSRVEELGSSQSGCTRQKLLSDSVEALCAYWRDET